MLWSMVAAIMLSSVPAFPSVVVCRFKADTEPVDLEILIGSNDHWKGSIDKDETKTIQIPEGPFTVVSKVFNPNLQATEDIRVEAHTSMCGKETAFSVPVFSPPPR